MLRRDGSRSTLELLFAGLLSLASVAPALGQAVPAAPPATNGSAQTPALPGTGSPAVTPPSVPSPANAAAQNNPPTAYNGTLLAYSLASVPDMMGDSPSPGRYHIGFFGNYPATIPLAGGDGYAKIADDTSPIPTDRVFFDYNYFNHAVQTGNGALIGLNRFTFGVEKTFLDGNCSIEVETPVDTGLSSNQLMFGTTDQNEGTVFGDMSLTLKCLLFQRDCLAVAVGAMVDLPTAPNGTFIADGYGTLRIQNDSVHVAPFLGFAYAPCCGNFFAIGFVQADFDTNGDPVNVVEISDPVIGRFRDPSLLYVDLSMGYWLFREDQLCGRYLTGIAPVVELHYTTTLQNYPAVEDAIVPIYGGTDCLNLTAGVHFQMGPYSMLTVGSVVPLLTSARDREFDSEVVVQFDRRF